MENKQSLQAEEMLEEVGLVGEMILVETYDEDELGKVLEQEYKPDEEVEKGTTVKYKAGGVAIPENSEFVGKPYKDVIKTLKALGVKVSISHTASTEYNKDMVEEVKEAGQILMVDSTVTIVVSTGPGPTVPTPTPTPDDTTGSETN